MISEPSIWDDGPKDHGSWIICPECGKQAFMEQWLIDEKDAIGSKHFCSHKCGQLFHSKHPEEHPGTKAMIKQFVCGF